MAKYALFLPVFFVVFFLQIKDTSAQNKNLFTLIPASDSGITFSNDIIDEKEKNILLYANFYGGAGVGVGDFNNDGLQDIYFAGNMVDDKLYLNRGDFKFEDVTKSSGIINDDSWSTGVTVADINGDGLLDIYVSNELYDYKTELRKNKLYINQGNAKFKEMAETYGLANDQRTRHATFLDYNNDGLLDLFILNQPPNPGSYSEFFGTKLLLPEYTSRLYKNMGGTSFKDVTEEAGLVKAGFPNGVSASDLNNDGWTDLYVTNDFYAPDYMFMNNQDGTFTNIANSALNHMSYYSMGVDVSDINNDGFLDIFTLDMVAEDNFRLKSNMSGMNPQSFWNVVSSGGHFQYMFNNFQLNNGNNTYSEIGQLLNMGATDWSWANLIADFDNDGEKDIYITNGLLRDIRNTDASKAVGDFVMDSADKWVKENPNAGDVSLWDILDLNKTLAILPSQPLENYAYKNNGNYNFSKVSADWGLDQKSFSNGAAYADFDNDGDLDIVVNNINSEAFLYKNNSQNNYVRFHLKSKKNNSVFGTRITLKYGDKQQVFETTNVRGIYSTSEAVAHFGLGNQDIVDEVTINWPDRTTTLLTNIKVNQEIEIFLEESKSKTKQKKIESGLFTDVTTKKILDYKHQENNFDDFEYQVLLPHKMSQFGPSLAVADVNNDGLEDVFVGGASGFSSQLFLQNRKGNFESKQMKSFESDKIQEDIDAVFFDVDSDGDQDLYVVSGGNEFESGDQNYQDRLYINNGKGNFSKSDKSLKIPSFSGSVVVPADYDNDGDMDLFIGGRFIPRDYPMPASSTVLENNNGKLIDVTSDKAKELNEIGMVTDAIWSDYDNDKDLDLIVVGEWMAITVFENKNGSFIKKELPDFQNTHGWWFSIEQGDFDNDGDMDFIAGNLGLNYKYKTTDENPFDVYYKDFDGNGSNDIVLGYYNYGKHYPVRGFSCSSQQVPKLKKEFKKYDVFASLEIDEVYGEENLDASLHYETNTFATSFIENLGGGKFKITQLPVESQFSSVNDMIIEDLNADGNLDILLVGNLYVSEIETTRNDAGKGLVLLGDGKNNFSPLTNQESGFFARGDAKKVKIVHVDNKKIVLVGNNNDYVQLFVKNN